MDACLDTCNACGFVAGRVAAKKPGLVTLLGLNPQQPLAAESALTMPPMRRSSHRLLRKPCPASKTSRASACACRTYCSSTAHPRPSSTSRSMSMQDKLKIVRSSLIYSNRLGSDIDIEVVERKRSSTLKHATSLLGSNVDRNWLARQKRVESSSNIFNRLAADQKNGISKYRGTVTGSGCSDCSVPYMSLIRLRTEFEKVLELLCK